ncbi:hypothetical protein ABQE44_24480 [Mycolicibacterium sp. XJ2546]
MTALQAWLNYRPIGPRSLTSLVCNVLGERNDPQPARPAEPVLLERGMERC